MVKLKHHVRLRSTLKCTAQERTAWAHGKWISFVLTLHPLSPAGKIRRTGGEHVEKVRIFPSIPLIIYVTMVTWLSTNYGSSKVLSEITFISFTQSLLPIYQTLASLLLLWAINCEFRHLLIIFILHHHWQVTHKGNYCIYKICALYWGIVSSCTCHDLWLKTLPINYSIQCTTLTVHHFIWVSKLWVCNHINGGAIWCPKKFHNGAKT